MKLAKKTVLGVWLFLKKVPWQLWAILAFAATYAGLWLIVAKCSVGSC